MCEVQCVDKNQVTTIHSMGSPALKDLILIGVLFFFPFVHSFSDFFSVLHFSPVLLNHYDRN